MQIILRLFFAILIVSNVNAQQRVISGKVTDDKGLPLVGATILEKKSNKGTESREGGIFTLSIPDSNARLIISFIGYSTTDVAVNNQTYIAITLLASVSNLDSMVVIGYGTSKKKDLTGAVSSVKEKDFNKGTFTSPDLLIQGKVSGVQITYNNGQPGGAATIKIRGNSALSGTGQPLFVIDGVPLDGRSLQAGNNPLNFINPADVASIDILKDASATAIYGSRAAYGVMIINTKKGQAGPPRLDVAVSVGVSSILKKIDVLNASEFRDAIKYYGVSPSFDRGGDEDAMDAILQNGIVQNYSLAGSGGNDNGKYRYSLGLLDQDGIIINTGFKKYSADLSGNLKFLESKKLGMDINLNASQYIQNVPFPEGGSQGILYSALKWNPTDSLINADGTFRRIHENNPVANVENIKNNLKVTTILGSISPYYKFTKWLEYRLLVSINYSTGVSRSSINQTVIPPGNPPGFATVRNNELTTTQVTNTLNFSKEILPDLKLDAVAGFEYTKFSNIGFSAGGVGADSGFGNFGLDYTNYIQYSSLTGRSISSFADPTSELQSFFGRTIFNYSDKYLLTATLRADGSSKFGPNNKYGYFPSVAAAWSIYKEHFFNVNFVNSLKLRVGWGKTGNQEFPPGSAQARYSFFDGGVIRQVNNPNEDLKWQSDRQYNIGLDFSIFENRISGTLDYFNKATTNLLFPSAPIQPAPPDAVVRWVNLDGEIQNKGFEVLINATIIKNKDFGFDLSVNSTFLKSNVSGLPSVVHTGSLGGPVTVQVIENGYPMHTFFTREFLGIDKSTGFSIYADSGTFYHLGNPNPRILLGFTPVFRYKQFSLTANMYGAFGQKIFFTPLMFGLNVGGIQTGQNIGTSVFYSPVKESLNNPSQSPSSRFIFNGDYLKMANLTLNYALGNVNRVFKDANIYITAQNLFIITKYPGFDPEENADQSYNGIQSSGVDNLGYPSSRTIFFGLKFSL